MNSCRQFLLRTVLKLNPASHEFYSQSQTYFKGLNPRAALSLYYQPSRNAGHSKWANIKHTKQSKDLEKSREIIKFLSLMKITIKQGGGPDPKTNSKLAQILAQIKEAKIPMAAFDKALQNFQIRKDEKSMVLPIKGPGGSVLVAEISSDNLNRTRQEINTVLRKNGGIVADDSALFMFEHKGIIISSEFDGKPAGQDHLDQAIEDAIEAGADDVALQSSEDYGNVFEFTTSASAFLKVKHALENMKYNIVQCDVDYIATAPKELGDTEIQAALKLYENLSNNPNVVKVSTNIA